MLGVWSGEDLESEGGGTRMESTQDPVMILLATVGLLTSLLVVFAVFILAIRGALGCP